MAKQEIIRLVAVNDRGLRIGEDHPNATLTDAEVDQIRDLHGFAGYGYRLIAKLYGQRRETVAKICRYERREQTVFDWKKVVVIPAKVEEVVGAD